MERQQERGRPELVLKKTVAFAYHLAADLPPNQNETRGHPTVKFNFVKSGDKRHENHERSKS